MTYRIRVHPVTVVHTYEIPFCQRARFMKVLEEVKDHFAKADVEAFHSHLPSISLTSMPGPS